MKGIILALLVSVIACNYVVIPGIEYDYTFLKGETKSLSNPFFFGASGTCTVTIDGSEGPIVLSGTVSKGSVSINGEAVTTKTSIPVKNS